MTTYKYYLANGRPIEYSIGPQHTIIGVIDRLVSDYYSRTHAYHSEEVLVQPNILSALKKEVPLNAHIRALEVGFSTLNIQTIAGPIRIISRSDLEWPIFMGTEQELKDNSFHIVLDEILA